MDLLPLAVVQVLGPDVDAILLPDDTWMGWRNAYTPVRSTAPPPIAVMMANVLARTIFRILRKRSRCRSLVSSADFLVSPGDGRLGGLPSAEFPAGTRSLPKNFVTDPSDSCSHGRKADGTRGRRGDFPVYHQPKSVSSYAMMCCSDALLTTLRYLLAPGVRPPCWAILFTTLLTSVGLGADDFEIFLINGTPTVRRAPRVGDESRL